MRSWARRAVALHGELVSLADVDLRDPRWWLVAGGAALGWERRALYVRSDAEPSSDTFIGHAAPPPRDPIADAIARARAARRALIELDGVLPDQPLATTVRRTAAGAILVPSALDAAAFAIGDRVWVAPLDDPDALAGELAALAAGAEPRPRPASAPFVTVTLGDEPIETARHGHRRAWSRERGPWLGLSRAGGLAIVSTCHLALDGHGHALLTARIAELTAASPATIGVQVPLPAPVTASPMPVAWRALAGPAPRVLPLAYALGRLLHRAADRPEARCSPTFQIPIAPGAFDDPLRRLRRTVPALASVRFEAGAPEPFELFAARAREALVREADGTGLVSSLLAVASAAPAPLAWKRRAVAADRPRWLERIAEVLGGRACVSRIRLDRAVPALCAVSSPAQHAGWVVTAIDDGARAGLTLCGAGATEARLDELCSLLPDL
ncbi:MAG TPA: hypothetical protein VLX92_17805 [Kofleriaceae bacterium]|nr:hypothetical protein [Kofleriaceae bacterium]